MKKCHRNIFLAIIVALAHIITIGHVMAQGLWNGIDDYGAGVFMFDNAFDYILLTGSVYTPDPPAWQQLIDYDPKCLAITLGEARWTCENWRYSGVNSESYRYWLRVTRINPLCDACVEIKWHPEFGRICFDADHYNVSAYILNECDDDVSFRANNHIDELIQFVAEVTYDNPDGEAAFPPVIEATIRSRTGHYPIDMWKHQISTNEASYTSNFYTARRFIQDSNAKYGEIYLGVSLYNYASASAWFSELQSAFDVKEIIFSDTIAINSGQHGYQQVCLPFNSSLSFRSKLNVGTVGWPSGCPVLGTIYAYIGDNCLGSSYGPILGGDNTTNIINSNFQLPAVNPGQENRYTFHWGMAIGDGPERELFTTDEVGLFNGFRANAILAPDLPPNNEILPDFQLQVAADPYPDLKEQVGIYYIWHWQKEGGGGQAHFSPASSHGRMSAFVAEEPGEYHLNYKIFHLASNTYIYSPEQVVQVKPRLYIVTPLDDFHKYCFDEYGHCDIDLLGIAEPARFSAELEWDIRPVQGTQIGALPDNRRGPEMEFALEGLPESNDEFGDFAGRNWVKMKLAGTGYNFEVERKIALFYPKDASNHGGGNPDEPNWFHYWKQGAVAGLANCFFRVCWGCVGFYRFSGFDESGMPIDSIFLSDDAAQVVGDFPESEPRIFTLLDGVDCTANVVAHESMHKWFYHQWMPGGIWHNLYAQGELHPVLRGADGLNRRASYDRDGDMIPNEVEADYSTTYNIYLNPDVANSYDLMYYYAWDGDQEVICRFIGEDARGDGNIDWSHGDYSRNWPGGH